MKPEDRQKVLLFEAADRITRSWWTLVAGPALGLAAGLVALSFMPKMYEASTRVFAAGEMLSPKVMGELVVDDPEVRLQKLREAALSDDSVRAIVDRVYHTPASAEEMDARMLAVRANTDVLATIDARYFDIRYADLDPVRAANVANLLADRIIEEAKLRRSERAREAGETLGSVADSVKQELEAKQEEIAALLAQYPNETPQQLQLNLSLRGDAQERLDVNLAEQRDTRARLKAIEASASMFSELNTYAGAVPPVSGGDGSEVPVGPVTTPMIAEQRAALEQLLLKYSDNHPDVRAKKRLIADLERQLVAEQAPPGTEASPEGAPAPSYGRTLDPWQVQLGDIRRTLERLEEEEQHLRAELGRYESWIRSAGVVGQKLADLQKDADLLRAKFLEYRGREETAQVTETIAGEGKGSYFEIVQPAFPPSTPARPRPLPILLGGLLGGLALFVGPVVLRTVLRPTIGSESSLRTITELPVLVAIPTLNTPEKIRRAFLGRTRNIGLAVVSIAILAVAFVGTRLLG